MAREDLIPLNKRTPEERKEIQRKGGINSGIARRKKRELKEYMEALLACPLDNDDKTRKKLTNKGLDPDMMDNKMLIATALFKRALTGDVYAIKELRTIIGEFPELNIGEEEDDNITVVVKRASKKKEVVEDDE